MRNLPKGFYASFLLLILVNFSCQNTPGIPLNSALISESNFCSENPEHSYEVYIPTAEKKCPGLPLLLILDPQGNGSEAIKHFRKGADAYKFALVASSRIKNNFPDFSSEIITLLNDVKSKYPVSDEIFLSGFSGGARMALGFAQHYPVDGLILCGALGNAEQIAAIEVPIHGIVGMGDFNFIEVAQHIFNPAKAPANLFIEFTQNMHIWPNSDILEKAMRSVLFARDVKRKCIDLEEGIEQFSQEERYRISSLTQNGFSLQAGLLARNMAKIPAFKDQDDLIAFRNGIEFSSSFNEQLAQLKESIRFELNVRNEYYTALQEKTAQWWEPEVKRLNEQIQNEEDLFIKMAYKRIKAFLGIVCYSQCQQSMQKKDRQTLKHTVEIYRLIEPENPDMYFFAALSALWEDDEKSALSGLQNLSGLGNFDTSRILMNFPEHLTDQLNFYP